MATVVAGIACALPAETSWALIGPAGGFVDFVASSPSAPETVYVGSRGGGIYVSADSGTTWRAANAGLRDTRITALAVSPADAAVVYAATQSGGFKTTDGGVSWTPMGGGYPATLVGAITIDPRSTSTLYACGSTGALSRSTDAGTTWTDISNEETARAQPRLVAVDPTQDANVYLATRLGGVFWTTDGGRTWDSSASGLENIFGDRSAVQSLAIDPSNPRRLYAGTTSDGVFVSTDSGRHWTRSSDGMTYGEYPNHFRFYYLVSDILFLPDGTAYMEDQYTIYRRPPHASDWTDIGLDFLGNDFCFGPGSPPAIYLASGRDIPGKGGPLAYGAFGKFDASGWKDHVFSFVTVWSIATDPNGSSAVVLTGNGSFTYAPEGGSDGWAGPNISYANFLFLLPYAAYFDPRAPGVVYAGTGGKVYKSFDGGKTYTGGAVVGDPTHPPVAIVKAFLPEPGTAGLFIGTTLGLFLSEDAGASWVAASSDLASRSVFALAADASIASTLWAGTDDGLYRSADSGAHWTRAAASVGGDIHAVLSLAGGRVFAGGPAGLFASADAGATWAPVPGVAMPVNALARHPQSAFVAAGTAGGVFESVDGGATWTSSKEGLDNLDVVSLAFFADGRLLAGTTGGVFERFVTEQRESAPRVPSRERLPEAVPRRR